MQPLYEKATQKKTLWCFLSQSKKNISRKENFFHNPPKSHSKKIINYISKIVMSKIQVHV